MKHEAQNMERAPESAASAVPEREPGQPSPEVKPEPVQEAPPAPKTDAPPTPSASGHRSISHDKLLTGIERILEENLAEAHLALPPDVARAFKEKGEETAVTIRDLVGRATVKVRAIVKAISDWLKMLPGINRFFLIQETKLKTDRILELKDWLQKKGP